MAADRRKLYRGPNPSPNPSLCRHDPPACGGGALAEANRHGAHVNAQASPLVMVAAGGTGRHLSPADALSAALSKRGIATALATDNRAAKYADYFSSMHVVPSATLRGRDPVSLVRTGA